MNNPITTISRERLEELASDFATEGYSTEEEQQEMARALLAVMDAPHRPAVKVDKSKGRLDYTTLDRKLPHGTLLYTTPPAPSAPEATVITHYQALPGWKLVPIEPTERMVNDGFESEPDEAFSELGVWDKYNKMSGCQQAAYKARLCWDAMLAAALRREVSNVTIEKAELLV